MTVKHKYDEVIQISTERHGRVVNIHVSYFGGPGLKPRAGDRVSWLTFILGFLRTSWQMLG
jgi:hypothetical protein